MYNTYYTYMLTTTHNTALYTGVTNNLERHIAEHRSGLIKGFTSKYKCHKLVYFETFSNIDEAIAREKALKEIAEGREKGRTEGRAEGILSVASNLIKMGLSTESITQATGLSPEEIEKIRLYGIGSMTTSK